MRMTRAELDAFRALRRKEGRRAADRILIEGWRALAEIPPTAVVSLAVRSDLADRPELEPWRSRGVQIKTLSERDLARISATEHSQGVVACCLMPPHVVNLTDQPGDAFWLALDDVSDPGNLGTILRTADWFGVTGVLLGRGCVDPFNDKVVRATAGSLFHVPMETEIDLAQQLATLKVAGCEIAVTAINGRVLLADWKPSARCIVVLGSEAHGVSDEVRRIATSTVAIPRHGHGESLNVAIAAGIIMAQKRR